MTTQERTMWIYRQFLKYGGYLVLDCARKCIRYNDGFGVLISGGLVESLLCDYGIFK